jgi:hypothetical protein
MWLIIYLAALTKISGLWIDDINPNPGGWGRI